MSKGIQKEEGKEFEVTRSWNEMIRTGDICDVSYFAFDAGLYHPTAITLEAMKKYVYPCYWEGPGENGIITDNIRVIISMLRYHMLGDVDHQRN